MAVSINVPQSHPVIEASAHRFQQGGRTVYYTILTIAQFDDALPDEIDTQIIKDNNRRFISSHARNIENYLQTTDAWVLGPVTLSIDPNYVEFEPYPGQPNDSSPALGVLRVVSGGATFLKMLDGQHRRRAIKDYRRSQLLSDSEIDRRNQFESCQMPVALYEEEDSRRLKQMFADMAQQRNMDAITKARFDRRDPFNEAADQVMLYSQWIAPYVEMNRPTIARTSDKLIAFNQLATNLKTLEFGYGGRASQIRSQEAANNMEDIIEKGLEWTDEFLPMARDEYLNLLSSDIEPDYISKERPKTLAYNGTMLRILAGAYYAWHQRFPTVGANVLASFISTMNLQPKAKHGPLIKAKVLDLGSVTLVARRQEVTEAIRLIVQGAHDEHQNNIGIPNK